jgi:hypothetical protein
VGLALFVISSVMLRGITTLAQADDFARTATVVAQVRKEIEVLTLQEAKDTIIKRLGDLPGLSAADVGSSQGYDLSFLKIRDVGAVVSFKSRMSGRTIWLSAAAQVDEAVKVINAVKFENTSLQEAKSKVETLKAIPGLVLADVGSIQGYDLGFRMVKAHGGVVYFKDRFNGRSVLIKGATQADELMKTIRQLKFDPVMSLTQAVQIIKGENFGKLGVVYADLGDEVFNGKRYNLQFCLDDKHGSLTVIRDTWAQRKVALNTSADADQIMKIVTELKFEGLNLTLAQDLIRSSNLKNFGVVYADFGDKVLDGKRHSLRFPIGDTLGTVCAF